MIEKNSVLIILFINCTIIIIIYVKDIKLVNDNREKKNDINIQKVLYDSSELENFNKTVIENYKLEDLPRPNKILYYVGEKQVVITKENENFEKIISMNIERAISELHSMYTRYELSEENKKKCVEYIFDDNPSNSIWFVIFEEEDEYNTDMQWLTFYPTNKYFEFSGSFYFGADKELTKKLQDFLLSEEVLNSSQNLE